MKLYSQGFCKRSRRTNRFKFNSFKFEKIQIEQVKGKMRQA